MKQGPEKRPVNWLSLRAVVLLGRDPDHVLCYASRCLSFVPYLPGGALVNVRDLGFVDLGVSACNFE